MLVRLAAVDFLVLPKADEKSVPKTHKRLKVRFLIGRNRINSTHFRESPLFQATCNIKTEKQTIQLILCQLDVRRLAEGIGHETDDVKNFQDLEWKWFVMYRGSSAYSCGYFFCCYPGLITSSVSM